MEEIILIVLILLTMLTTFCLYKMMDKRGFYFSLIIMNLLAFVLSFKISYIFKMNVNLGIIPFIASLTIIYIFITKYGMKENKNLILISLYSNITVSLLIAIMNFFIPAITETISINMEGTFEYNFKILIAYPFIMAISQILTIKLFNLIQTIQNNLSIGIALTYIIVGLFYTVLYHVIIYINILAPKYSIFLGISTYIIGLAITVLNIFLANYMVKKKVIK